jgi:hypothetical protein
MKTKYVRGDGPNDPETLVQPDYSFGRGKAVPPPVRFANIGGHGLGTNKDDLSATIEAGRKVLDEALK